MMQVIGKWNWYTHRLFLEIIGAEKFAEVQGSQWQEFFESSSLSLPIAISEIIIR